MRSPTVASRVPEPSGAQRPPGPRLRIGELARRAGVPRATIHHYVREGLLPRPHKSGRTMAYYEPSCIERILLIKDLQRRYLPLGVIRRLLGTTAAPAQETGGRGLAALAEVNRALRAGLEQDEGALARQEVPTATGVEARALAALERLGLVRTERLHGRDLFSPPDVAILRAVGAMRRAGLTEAAGFRVEDLTMYRDAMTTLLAQEVALFTQRIVGKRSQPEALRLARAAVMGASELLAALRRKLLADSVIHAMPTEQPSLAPYPRRAPPARRSKQGRRWRKKS